MLAKHAWLNKHVQLSLLKWDGNKSEKKPEIM